LPGGSAPSARQGPVRSQNVLQQPPARSIANSCELDEDQLSCCLARRAAAPRKQHHVIVTLAWRAAAVVLTLAGTVLVALAWGSSGEPPMGETLAVALSGTASLALGVRLWLTQRADDVGGLTWWAVAVVAGAFVVLALAGVAPEWLAGAGIAAVLCGSVAWRAQV
jgi:hypothetical protein